MPTTGKCGTDTCGTDTCATMQGARDFTLVSEDADFAEMVMLYGPPPKVICLRCGHQTTSFVADPPRRRADAIDAFGRNGRLACLEIY